MEKSIFNIINHHTFDASIYYQFSGISQTLPFHTFGPAKRNDYIVHFVLNGQGTFFVDNKRFYLHSGDIFLIRPKESVFYQSDIKNPWTYAWISFNGNEAHQIIDAFSPFKNNHHAINTFHQLKYLNIIQQTLKLSDTSPKNELKLNQLVNEFLIQIMQEQFPQKNIKYSYFEGAYLAKQAREYIDNHFDENINIINLAKNLNINRSYLTRIFTNNFGISPKAWLSGVRINKASELLQMGELSINKISETVGFNNISVFNRSFTKITGETPSQYRKNRQYKHSNNINIQQIKNLLKNAKTVQQTT